MRFRLTYEGPLKATQRDATGQQPDRLAEHKQCIRKKFHQQLKQLWATNRFLREHREPVKARLRVNQLPIADPRLFWSPSKDAETVTLSEYVANLFQRNGYRFVPLVREEISLLCSLDVLFLRRDAPGSAIQAGDIDNRIKTLIDCLRMPKSAQELVGNETPASDEDPFYCLLEDDNLVSAFSVETDTLLDPPQLPADEDRRMVRIVITVDLSPYDVTKFNLSFA
jgi:hypothetical protein